MKTMIAAVAGVCLGLATFSGQGQAATMVVLPPVVVTAPRIVPAWWAGPSTVCHHGPYGGVWCRPARPLGWVPGHHD